MTIAMLVMLIAVLGCGVGFGFVARQGPRGPEVVPVLYRANLALDQRLQLEAGWEEHSIPESDRCRLLFLGNVLVDNEGVDLVALATESEQRFHRAVEMIVSTS